MAGRPKRKLDLAKLEQMGVEPLEELLEQGKSITDICKILGVQKKAIHDYLDTPERSGILARARVRAADNLAVETLEIADNATPETANVARLQVDTRKWIASKWNGAIYGDKSAQVNISFNDLHMGSLRRVTPDAIDVDIKEN